jgi:hypothetical protein
MKINAKFWWKTYIWLMAVLFAAAVSIDLYYYESRDILDIIFYGTWLFSLVGVFGFAYSKIIMSKRLWQFWLPIVVLWDAGLLVNQFIYEPLEMEPWFLVSVVVITGIMMLPEYLALYFYGYRSNPLWSLKSSI